MAVKIARSLDWQENSVNRTVLSSSVCASCIPWYDQFLRFRVVSCIFGASPIQLSYVGLWRWCSR